jgi:hypothetical protein
MRRDVQVIHLHEQKTVSRQEWEKAGLSRTPGPRYHQHLCPQS